MGDLERSGISEIVLQDCHLRKQYLAIQIAEKEIQLKQLDVALDRLQTVDYKKILHAIEKCKKELEKTKREYESVIIDVKGETKKGGK